MNRKVIWGAQLVLLVLCALALKFHYSTATVNQLRWILAPTTLLVELFSGKSFEFESYTGYMSSDHTFVIAAPCAGVNFLITALLMLGITRLWRDRSEVMPRYFIPSIAVTAFVATLIANTARITLALNDVRISWLSANQQHRLEGIVVYFGFLLLLFFVSERLRSASPSRLLIPLGIYYATTLGIPLLNGSYKQGSAFWEHSAFVLLLPLLLLFVAQFACFIFFRRGRLVTVFSILARRLIIFFAAATAGPITFFRVSRASLQDCCNDRALTQSDSHADLQTFHIHQSLNL